MKQAEYIHAALTAITEVQGPFTLDTETPDAALRLRVHDTPGRDSIEISERTTPEQVELLIHAFKRDIERRGFVHDEDVHPKSGHPHVWIGIETEHLSSHKGSSINKNRLMAWALAWLNTFATKNPHNNTPLINCPTCGTLTWNWLADVDTVTDGAVETMTCINCENEFNVHMHVDYDGAEPQFHAEQAEPELPDFPDSQSGGEREAL